jgi:hypothetical protein
MSSKLIVLGLLFLSLGTGRIPTDHCTCVVPQEKISTLAHQYWYQRGGGLSSKEEELLDWYKAKAQLLEDCLSRK